MPVATSGVLSSNKKLISIEEKDWQLLAWELKWKSQKAKIPSTFLKTYNASGSIIHRDNFREFVMDN